MKKSVCAVQWNVFIQIFKIKLIISTCISLTKCFQKGFSNTPLTYHWFFKQKVPPPNSSYKSWLVGQTG